MHDDGRYHDVDMPQQLDADTIVGGGCRDDLVAGLVFIVMIVSLAIAVYCGIVYLIWPALTAPPPGQGPLP